jgi:hypothetical protein
MRTPEQEALLRELLFILPDFAVEYRRMAKWFADAKPVEGGSALIARRESANEIIDMVRRVTVDYDELKADYDRVSPLRSLLQHAQETKPRKPRLKLDRSGRAL